MCVSYGSNRSTLRGFFQLFNSIFNAPWTGIETACFRRTWRFNPIQKHDEKTQGFFGNIKEWGDHVQYIPINMLWMDEILHHLGCTKPCKQWDKLPIKWCIISSINSITTLAQAPRFENNIFWESCQVRLLRTWNGKKKESSRHPVCGGHFLRSMICPFKKKGGICYLVSYLVSEFVSWPRGYIFGFRIGCCCSTLKFLKSFRSEASDESLTWHDVTFRRECRVSGCPRLSWKKAINTKKSKRPQKCTHIRAHQAFSP